MFVPIERCFGEAVSKDSETLVVRMWLRGSRAHPSIHPVVCHHGAFLDLYLFQGRD